MNRVCVDASFALGTVLPEPKQSAVLDIWKAWDKEQITVLAPWLFAFETHAVLRRKVWNKELSSRQGQEAWDILLGLEVQLQHHEQLWTASWNLAEKHKRPTTYDTCYVALAELLSCELWTLDQALASSMRRDSKALRLP